jgi:putative aldouronate transport system permease protein
MKQDRDRTMAGNEWEINMEIAKKPLWRNKNNLFRKIFKQRYRLALLAPAFLLIVVFSYAPLYGWIMAFVNYRIGTKLLTSEYVGFFYFIKFFKESNDYIYLLQNTLAINVLSIVISLPLSAFVAILLKEVRWKFGAKIVQTVTFFPFFVSWVITYALITSLFSVNSGSLNIAMIKIGVIDEGINLIGSPKYSWGLMVSLDVWKYLGYNTIIFLSTLSGISLEQYEAAEIDGANRFQQIVHITIPHLVPTLCVLIIINSGWIFSSNLEQFYIYTNGTNWSKMEVLDMYVYKFGLKNLKYSYATAVGIMKSIISLGLVIGINKLIKKLDGTSIF